MATSYHTGPGSWRIAMEATEAELSFGRRKERRLPLDVSGAFYLRPDGALAGFTLQLPAHGHDDLPADGQDDGPRTLRWEAADVDREGHAWLRLGHREVRAAVSVMCAAIPGDHPYVKIVLAATFSSWSLRLPGVPRLWPRRVTLTLFSELRPVPA